MKQIQAGIWLSHTQKHYGIEIAIQSFCIHCETDLCEMTHIQHIEIYMTIV